MSAVTVVSEAFADERYEELADALGLADADCARGKMLRLWRQCTIEQTETLLGFTITRVLGANGVDALVRARLGEVMADGRVRIKGTAGRIEWLQRVRDNGKYGKLGGRPKPSRVSSDNPAGLENKTPITTTITTTTTKACASPVRDNPAGLEERNPGGLSALQAKVDASTTDIEQAKRKRRAPETPLPEDWEPSAKHIALASERHVDCLLESRAFRAHAESHDRRCVRWDAAFTQWLLKSRPANGTRAGPNANPTRVALDELARLEALERDA